MKQSYQDIFSSQKGPHQNLLSNVEKHRSSNFLRPNPDHQLIAFDQIRDFLRRKNNPIILDSCCGTGLSSQNLAQEYPSCLVIGVDKSQARLERAQEFHAQNLLLLRADIFDIWQLLAQEKIMLEKHFMFFPNPWPKSKHLKRRFYAHPVFNSMLTITRYFELRTNWEIGAKECALAFEYCGFETHSFLKSDQTYISLFEKKYVEQRCPIYIVQAQQKGPEGPSIY